MTSNSTNYSIDRDTLIRMAFEKIGAATEGEPIQPEMNTVAARWLNLQLKNHAILGFRMWKRERKNITLIADQNSYTIGQKARGTTTATTASKLVDSSGRFVNDVAVGDTVLNTTDNTSTTVSAIDSTTTLSIASDIFTTGESYEITIADVSLARPERILECNRKDSSNNTITVTPLSLEEYENLPDKTQTGIPVNYFYDPLLNNGRLYLWLTPGTSEAADYSIDIVVATQVHDMDRSTDLFDFPQEWLLPIVLNLAFELSDIYGDISVSKRDRLESRAVRKLDDVANYDQDTTSVYLQPDLRR